MLSEQYPSFARKPASVGNLKDLMNDGIVKDYDDCKAAAVQARKRDKPTGGAPVARTSLRQQLAEAGLLEESSSEFDEELLRIVFD